jgi:hypothetical protein
MTKYIVTGFCAFATIIAWNVVLIERDQELFDRYDSACKTQPHNPQCKYSK